MVGYSYLGFVVFTVLFQVVSHCYLKKRKLERAQAAAMVNQTNSTQVDTFVSRNTNGSRLTGAQGKPVNISDASSLTENRKTNLSADSGSDF